MLFVTFYHSRSLLSQLRFGVLPSSHLGMQDNRKYSVRFLGGAVHNQLNDADEIILEKLFLQPRISPGDKLKFSSSNEIIFLTKISLPDKIVLYGEKYN